MKKIYIAVVLALMALLSITMSASAATNTRTFDKGVGAFAYWYPASGGSTYLEVFKDTTGTYLYVDVCDSSNNCGYNYNVPIPDGSFVMQAQGALKSATLSPVTVDLIPYSGSPQPTVTINADWTGVGDKYTDRTHYKTTYPDGTTIMFNGASSYREATATGTDSINGDLGSSIFADLFSFKNLEVDIFK